MLCSAPLAPDSARLRINNSEVNSVKFNEFNAVVVSAGYDRTVRPFDCRLQSSDPIQTIDAFQDSVMSVNLTNTEIIAGSVDGTVRTFDIRKGRETVDNLGHPVNCISLSNDRNCLLAGCLDSTVRLLGKSMGPFLLDSDQQLAYCLALHQAIGALAVQISQAIDLYLQLW